MGALYLLPFFLAFSATAVLITLILYSLRFFRVRNVRTGRRHTHNPTVSRFGGVAMIMGFFIAVYFDPNLILETVHWGILGGVLLILVAGLSDDIFKLDWKIQLFFHISLAIFIFIFGVRVEFLTNPFGGTFPLVFGDFFLLSFLFVILWTVVFMNAMNWLDGLDGLSGSIGFVASIVIFLLTLLPEVNQPPTGILTMALAGSILAFVVFNFYPARIMAGTTGAWFMGFLIAVLAVFAGAKIATALLIMSIPLIDLVWVIAERFRAGRPITQADRRHLHYKLRELGWSPRKISFVYVSATVVLGIVALQTKLVGKFFAIIVVTVIMILTFVWINRALRRRMKHNGFAKT